MRARIALAQTNPTVGDLEGNKRTIERCIGEARSAGADVVAFPELAVTGYPPEDLVLRRSFVDDNLSVLHAIARDCEGIGAVVGFIDAGETKPFNAAALIKDGEVRAVYHKHRLPNYGVFDEERYFARGSGIVLARVAGITAGITICEDVWETDGPHVACASAGASIVININGSPYHRGKGSERLGLLQRRARENGVAFAYVNMTGGQDELVFDGQSMVVDRDGSLVARAAQFTDEMLILDFSVATSDAPETAVEEGLKIVDLGEATHERSAILPRIAPEMGDAEEVYAALVLGVRDYLGKNGFREAFLGLSGGIDSSLTAAIAADALGAGNVTGVIMPSRFTSDVSLDLAKQVASNLGIRAELVSIADVYTAFLAALDFAGTGGLAEENLQPRIRGTLLMGMSNRTPASIVLSTGNKSELATGYSTLYGDMAGGFAVLKDVPKVLVYALAEWRNRSGEVIPRAVIDRPPTAELKEGQLDTDTLPAYEELDPILEAYVEDDRSVEEIVAMGFDTATVGLVADMVDRAEYKRRQAPPGIKITERAFGRDRRLPITNRYRD